MKPHAERHRPVSCGAVRYYKGKVTSRNTFRKRADVVIAGCLDWPGRCREAQ